jgi:RNA polymerase sigma-70 factor (ECF subfamily)
MDERLTMLDRLYREAGPLVHRRLQRWVGSGADADELLQDTFAVAASRYTALTRADSPRAWLLGIARNVARRFHRRVRLRRTEPLGDLAQPPAEEDARLEEMRRAIASLPPELREVIELRLSEDLSYAEIAASLGIPDGTVRSRLHRAVSSLRDWARTGANRTEP